MRVNLSEHIRKDTMTGHMVLEGLTRTIKSHELIRSYAEKQRTPEGIFMNVRFLVDDIEVDLEDFIKRWQDQVDKSIEEKAKDFVQVKFNDVDDLLQDLKKRIEPEIEKRLEDWEKEMRNENDTPES